MKSPNLLFTRVKRLFDSALLFITFSTNLSFSAPIIQTSNKLSSSLVMTAVGQDFTNKEPPLLSVFKSGSNRWAVEKIIGLPANGRIEGTACTLGGTTSLCVALGQTFGSNQPPLLFVSTDAGSRWTMPIVKNTLPPRFYFKNVSCTGHHYHSAICVASGHNPSLNTPLLLSSIDGGNHWAISKMPNLSGFFSTNPSCTGDSHSAMCVIGATYQDDSQPPVLLVSTDGGQHFALQTIPALPKEGFLMSTSCTGRAQHAICVAVGKDITHHKPLLITRTTGHDEWHVKTISGPKVDGFFTSTSCTGSGKTAVCIAGGMDITHHRPLLAVSRDADHWVVPTVPGLSADGIVNSVSCTGNGNTARCIAAGENLSTYTPLLIASADGGKTWKIQKIPSPTTKGTFLHTSCASNRSDMAICIAAGENFTTGSPLLVQSIHQLNAWIIPSIVDLPLKGAFYSTSATI